MQRMASASAHPEDAGAATGALIPEPTSDSFGQAEAPALEQRHGLGPPVLPAELSSLSW